MRADLCLADIVVRQTYEENNVVLCRWYDAATAVKFVKLSRDFTSAESREIRVLYQVAQDRCAPQYSDSLLLETGALGMS